MRYLMINNQGHLLSVRYLTGGRQMSFVIFLDPKVSSLRRRRRLRAIAVATNRQSPPRYKPNVSLAAPVFRSTFQRHPIQS